MKNILFIKGDSQYGALRLYIDEFSHNFSKLGFHVLVLDGLRKSFSNDLALALDRYHFDILFTCNGQFIEDYHSIADYFCTYICDHPAAHYMRYEAADSHCIFIQCDFLHQDYARRYYPQIGYIGCVPLSGSFYPEYIPFEERTYPIVFTGSYTDPVVSLKTIFEVYPDSLQPLVHHMIRTFTDLPQLTPEEVLSQSLAAFGITVSDTDFRELMGDFDLLTDYIRCYFRDKLIHTLLENGFTLHVFGNGWDNFKTDTPERLFIHTGGAYCARKAVAHAFISLNCMPWFKDGFQERIASAMLSGTIAVTDTSAYISRHFTDGENIITYSLDAIEELVPKLKKLFSDTAYTKRLAENGHSAALRSHTWAHRSQDMAEQLLTFTDGCCRTFPSGSRLILPPLYRKRSIYP